MTSEDVTLEPQGKFPDETDRKDKTDGIDEIDQIDQINQKSEMSVAEAPRLNSSTTG